MRRAIIIRVILLTAAMALSDCAHSQKGTVTMKVSDEEAHVGLGANDVHPGDRIEIYGPCLSPKQRWANPDSVELGGCNRAKLGEATIARVLNKDYSIVKVDPGVHFDEGALIRKK